MESEKDYSNDPLKGAHGLKWHERDSSTLDNDEWIMLIGAMHDGRISAKAYRDWLKECDELQKMRRK